jgi:SNF2 family DNA or RNA helicase
VGINLTKAERVIYYANDYTLINRLQSEDRAHRAGQNNKVGYYDIICNDTIDISILNVLMGKKSIADIITKDNILNMAKGK